MGIAYFDGDQISHNSIAILKGTSGPRVIIFPRTIGGILQESGVVQKSLLLRSYLIPPSSGTRGELENFFHQLNEKIGSKEASLVVNNNTYLKANVSSISYDAKVVDNYTSYDINFELGEQNDVGTIRQLSVPNLVGFSRGRKLYFKTELEDLTTRTFTFWHNFDIVKNFDTEITIKRGKDPQGFTSIKVIRAGGFEKIVAYGWIIGPEIENRQNLEAYFYNIINGPLGRLGTLTVEGSEGTSKRVFPKCILTDVEMSEETHQTLHYTLTFLTSLQC